MAGNIVSAKSNATPTVPASLGEAELRPAPTPPEGKSTLNLQRIRAMLLRFKWLIAGILALGTAGSIIATKFIEPQYQVGATIRIEDSNNPRGPLQADELLSSRNWIELLTTYIVMDPVVKKERLFLQPKRKSDLDRFAGFDLADRFLAGKYELSIDNSGKRYLLKREGGLVVGEGALGDSIGIQVGFRWVPALKTFKKDETIAFEILTPREASNALISDLRTRLGDRANFLRVSLSGQDAKRTASTVNSLLERFVTVAADLKRDNVRRLRIALEEQLGQAELNLTKAEQELESYRVRTITLPGEEAMPIAPGLQMTQNPTMGTFFQQKTELEATRRDRKAIEDVLTRAKSGELAVDAFNTIPSVKAAPDLNRILGELSAAEASRRTLLQKYTPEHKLVKDADTTIFTLRTTIIPAYAQALVQQLKQNETDLQGRIGSASRELASIPVRTMTEQRLRRDADAKRAIYTNLNARYEEAKLTELSAIPDVSVLDTAVAPVRPTKNTASRIVMMGVLGSLAAGLGLAFLLDRFDPRFRYPEQASQELGLTILGVVPEIKNGRTTPDETAQLIEAFRSVRMSLAHSFGSAGPVLLTITSPGAGDGKSLVSANLSLSFAEAGYNTLLIDGDTRRGEMHRMFGMDRRPGLLDYLSGDATIDQIIRAAKHSQLKLIPSGSRRQRGPELLGSARMAQLIAELKGRYDVIITDSPPLGAGIDPFVLASLCGNMVLVLRAGETDREMAESKLQVVDRLPIRLLGVVLNDVRSRTGPYKYYSYISGYASEEESAAWKDEEPPTGNNLPVKRSS
ncbi:MAG TPA: polysaccharide biosynthesis tyrosine autokinase [Gemmatimonadales bacterium]|nr:polysaccharide biosynthesis tyrosine autokinase [Gemmatimonadales bacterium]